MIMIIFDQKICQINSWKLNFDKEIIDFDHLKKKFACGAEKSEISYTNFENFENLRVFRVVYRFLVGNPDLTQGLVQTIVLFTLLQEIEGYPRQLLYL